MKQILSYTIFVGLFKSFKNPGISFSSKIKCLGASPGGFQTTPTATMKTILNLTSVEIFLQGMARNTIKTHEYKAEHQV